MDGDDTSRWAPVVGRWRTEGHIVDGEQTPVIGSDVYELLPGGHFLIHHVDVMVGDTPVRAIEIIGEPAPDGKWLARSFDNAGATELMTVQPRDDGTWLFEGGPSVAHAAQVDAAVPGAGAVRSTLTFAADGTTMDALWERSDDGKHWTDWMRISFTRVPDEGIGA